ncbi:MAG: transglycosylase domain-containing protein [Oscillospiraceae bacterium]|nr:transglycosylase domain-containing protein [Oscillospiraceae bacterium]
MPYKNRRNSTLSDIFKPFGGFFITIARLIVSILVVVVITGCIVASVMAVYVFNMVDDSDLIDIRNLELSYTTMIYAENKDNDSTEDIITMDGVKYSEIHRMQGDENRVWVNIEDMPDYLVKAAVAGEDKRFYSHQGVDWQSTVWSFIKYCLGDSMRGASTITQQLIKNVTNDKAVRVDRKIREILRALTLEKNYTKNEILEVYLNVIPLGNNTNGVQAAALYYFDKEVSELSLGECASLVAITQNPSKFHLASEKTIENNYSRRLYVLNTMLELEWITQEEYDEAAAEVIVPLQNKIVDEKTSPYQSWFIDTVINEVRDDLCAEYGYTKAQAINLIENGGLRIFTTVDVDMQDHIESKYLDDNTFPAVRNETKPQSAMVILDYDGAIKAIVGGRGEKEGNRVFNRATMAKRHIGSTIKPISAYALAFENNLITYSTIFEDAPVYKKGQDGWKGSDFPVNYYKGYRGLLTVERALAISANTIPVRLVDALTPQRCYNFLTQKLHFTTLVESDINIAPMSLGSFTYGATLLELASAYQIFGNGGVYHAPHSYTKVYDFLGNLVLEKDYSPEQVISSENATIINRLMWNVVNASFGSGTAGKLSSDMPVVGKTGTSSENYDLLFVGLTPYYVGAVYYGYDLLESVDYIKYSSPIIWKNVMEDIHKNLEIKDFELNPNVLTLEFCEETGDLATENCTKTRIGYYSPSNLPDYCSLHSIDNSESSQPEESYPEESQDENSQYESSSEESQIDFEESSSDESSQPEYVISEPPVIVIPTVLN